MMAFLNGLSSSKTAACMSSFFSQPASEPSRGVKLPFFAVQDLGSFGPSNFSCTTGLTALLMSNFRSASFSARLTTANPTTPSDNIVAIARVLISRPLRNTRPQGIQHTNGSARSTPQLFRRLGAVVYCNRVPGTANCGRKSGDELVEHRSRG